MNRQPHLHRRTLLKGIGGVAIGLPMLEEMLMSSALAQSGKLAGGVPTRSFNVFFGLGMPKPLQYEGFDDVLEPLTPLKDKLLIMRGIDHLRVNKPGINAHYDGSTGAFTAEPPDGTARSGGPSIDQVIRHAHYPDGLPPGMVPTLIGGTFFRRDRPSRYAKSFNLDGTVAASVQERPRDLFDRIFGTVPTDHASDPRRERLRRSVLDSVVEQSKRYTGRNSPLAAQSRARVEDHLDRIREYEHRAFSQKDKPQEQIPDRPPRSKLLHGGEADPGGEGIDITLDELVEGWRLMADLYAMAIQMDRVRFGSINFLSAGERIRLTGHYEHMSKTYDFDDSKELNATGAMGCSHEYWHQFNENAGNEAMRAHLHMKMREVAYFLQRLDEPDAMEDNGRSILENSLFTISTESGDGRHSDWERELSGVFHAVSGANGRFKTGEFVDVDNAGLHVYNTMLETMEADRRLGPSDYEHQPIDAIRA